MEHLEMVEKLKEKTGVSYEDAKAALTACEWDMLDAIVYLEKLDKIKEPAATYSTKYEQTKHFEQATQAHSQKSTFSDVLNRFFSWCGAMIKKGNENFFTIEKEGRQIVTMPVTILVIIIVFAFWVVVPLLVVGLFLGFKYSFSGPVANGIDLNNVMDKASEAAENIKRDFEKKDNE